LKDRRVVVLAVLVFGASLSLVAYWVSSGTSNHQADHTQARPESQSLKQDLQEITKTEKSKRFLNSVQEGGPRLEQEDIRTLENAEVLSPEEARLLEEIEGNNQDQNEKRPERSENPRDKGGR
jgi:hypothetical protein